MMLVHGTNEWASHTGALQSCLDRIEVSNGKGIFDVQDGFIQLQEMAVKAREAKKTLFLIGNGASASMASHFSADLCKNAHMRTEVFTDLSLVTALGNDLGYDQVFAVPMRFRMTEGDMLVAISSSGESPNVIAGIEAARECGGQVVTITGFAADNTMRSLGDLNFWVPAGSYGMAETSHAAILHFWMDRMAETVDPIWD